MSAFNIEDSAAVATIAGWVQMVKGWLPESVKAYAPALAIIFGIVYVVAAKPSKVDAQGIVLGVVLGLTASGMYSAVKNTAEKITTKP